MVDSGSTLAPGTVTHHITLYKAPRGALVFGAGTVQFSFGLDTVHDGPAGPSDQSMQQAAVNLFADMGAQPAQLMSGLTAATASTDTRLPTATVDAPSQPAVVGRPFTISGSATDTDGMVGGVEVSVDSGATWHPATSGATSWSYTWTPPGPGTVSVEARATDDSANTQSTPAHTRLIIEEGGCPCTILGTTTPAVPDSGDSSAYELGIRFRSTVNGTITGIRFYKSAANTGTHTGTLWSVDGRTLATGIFTGETATGWQTLTFATPVAINVNTLYVASYHTAGHYSIDPEGLAVNGLSSSPLFAPPAGTNDGNGVFSPGASAFPKEAYSSSNYYVDVSPRLRQLRRGGSSPKDATVTRRLGSCARWIPASTVLSIGIWPQPTWRR